MPNFLTKAEVLYATPGWGDGKNDDSSMVDTEILIKSSDGNLYAGFGKFRDGTGITKNGDRTMPIEMSGGINQLDKSTITKLTIQETYWLEAGRFHSDHWDLRRELILTFADGTQLYSGYNDPAEMIDFADDKQDIKPIITSQFYNLRTLKPPYQ